MGYKILLADDDRDLLEMLGRYFEMKGYQILQAGNGRSSPDVGRGAGFDSP